MSVTHRMESQRGHIGREIKSGLDKNNKPWANFSLGVDVNRRDEQGSWEKIRTDWYQVSVFGAQAKNVADSFDSGTPVVVTGDVSESYRVVEGPDGAPTVQTRKEVRADMVAPDMILTSVVVPQKPARTGPSQVGPGTAGPVGTDPASSTPPSPGSSGPRQASGPDPQAAEGFTPGIDEEVFAARRSASLRAPEAASPTASAPDGAGSIWPPAVQPGSGAAGLR